MNKSLLGFFLIFIALLVGALYFTSTIQKPFISALNSIKSSYHDITEFSISQIDKHFFQAAHISDLEEELQKYEKNHLVMQQLASEVNDLFIQSKSELKTDPKVQLVRTISYQKFANLNRVWLEVSEYNSSKIYGLTYKELVAGIVISQNSRPLGLLNKDIQSTYAVFVGDKKAPGIAHGNNSKNLIIKFIPSWFDIKKGDKVTTSGLDHIFFKGLKVGTVISVTKSQGYQNAVVEPFYKANDPNYFLMIKKVK